ncbi:MAG: hypothetical protein AAFY42_05405 [Pseudomonadota bacterium]
MDILKGAAALGFALPATALAQESSPENTIAAEQSQFVGRYDGNSFETAMGMVIRADGTFEWGLSVGSLDMRAQGTWFEEDDTIIFVSDPKPVSPEFVWSGVEANEDGPFLRVVWAKSDSPFQYASVRGQCANGTLAFGYVDDGTWSPESDCDKLEWIQFRMQSYDLRSEIFVLSGEREVARGETIRFEFHRNDLGVANFDGVMGRFEDGKLRVVGDIGSMVLRKVPAPAE